MPLFFLPAKATAFWWRPAVLLFIIRSATLFGATTLFGSTLLSATTLFGSSLLSAASLFRATFLLLHLRWSA